MKSADKVQLNLCVDHPTDDLFRVLAQKAGFGKRPSPFLGRLLELYTGNMRSISKRLKEQLEENPDLLMQREQLFYAQETYLALRDAITAAQDRMAREVRPRDEREEKV